jgi:hypothetical protein
VWVTSVAQSIEGSATLQATVVAIAGVLLALLSPITLTLGQAATMFAAREIDEGRTVGPLHAYTGALRRALPILATELGVLVVLVFLSLTVVLLPVALVVLVFSLLLIPVVLFEHTWGWRAFRRSAHLVRVRWVKVVVLIALTNGLVLAIGPLLGTALILGTPLPFAVSNAVAGIVYALFVPLVALNAVYVYADVLVRDELEPREEKAPDLPAEASIA